MEKMIPQNIDAEKGVLGSIVIDPEAITQVIDFLRPRDFYRNTHRVIFEKMLTLYEHHEPADFITLSDALEGELEKEGGPMVYLSNLMGFVPTSGNIKYYADIVRRTAQHRDLIHIAGEIAAMAYEQSEDALEKSQQMLFSIDRPSGTQDFCAMPEMIVEYMEELDLLHEHRGEFTGTVSGYVDLDAMLGGFQKTDLILLGARPSIGKTALALSMAFNAMTRGKQVAMFSLEMGRQQLIKRMMAMASKVDMQRLRSGWIDDEDWEKIVKAAGELSELKFFVNDVAGNPISSMRSQLRRLIQQHGELDLIIVDYVGLIEPEDNKNDNRVNEISKISRGLKLLAREFNVPILALSQLNRQVEARQDKRPGLGDLRDSGSLEQDADIVMFLYREDYYHLGDNEYQPTNIAELNVAKHRNGPVGLVELYYEKEHTMFYPLEKAVEPDEY